MQFSLNGDKQDIPPAWAGKTGDDLLDAALVKDKILTWDIDTVAAAKPLVKDLRDMAKKSRREDDALEILYEEWQGELERMESRPPTRPWVKGLLLPLQIVDELPTCLICGWQFMDDGFFHLDHRIPWSQGGADLRGNWQMLCSTCNHAKGDRLISNAEFRQERFRKYRNTELLERAAQLEVDRKEGYARLKAKWVNEQFLTLMKVELMVFEPSHLWEGSEQTSFIR